MSCFAGRAIIEEKPLLKVRINRILYQNYSVGLRGKKEMVIGWFTLDLYCDGEHDNIYNPQIPSPKTYSDENEELAITKAKSDGWVIKEGKCLCQKCVKRGIVL